MAELTFVYPMISTVWLMSNFFGLFFVTSESTVVDPDIFYNS